MNPDLQQQLILAASKMKAVAIDPDVFRATITESIDPNDSEAVEKAAKAVVERHPNLFKIEKPWSQLSEGDFQKREAAFRASLRTSHPISAIPWKLDSALLEDHELQALHRVLGGRGSSYDRSILDHAQRRLSTTGTEG